LRAIPESGVEGMDFHKGSEKNWLAGGSACPTLRYWYAYFLFLL
jgi:hypothetical protein